jgi:hypothetical protein
MGHGSTGSFLSSDPLDPTMESVFVICSAIKVCGTTNWLLKTRKIFFSQFCRPEVQNQDVDSDMSPSRVLTENPSLPNPAYDGPGHPLA